MQWLEYRVCYAQAKATYLTDRERERVKKGKGRKEEKLGCAQKVHVKVNTRSGPLGRFGSISLFV